MPKVGAAAVMPFFIVAFVLRVISRIRCILHLPDIICHGAGLIQHQNDICGDVLGYRGRSLRAGGKGFQRDGVGTVIVGRRRLADLHAAVNGGIIRIDRCGHNQRAEKGQTQKQR